LSKPHSRISSRLRLLSSKQESKTRNEPKEKTKGTQLVRRVAIWYSRETEFGKRSSKSRERLAKQLPREVLVVFRTIKWAQDQDIQGYITSGNRNEKEREQSGECSVNILVNASGPGCPAVEQVSRGVRGGSFEDKPCNYCTTSPVVSAQYGACLQHGSLQRFVGEGSNRIASGVEVGSEPVKTPLTPIPRRVRQVKVSSIFGLPWSQPAKIPTTIKEAVQGLIPQEMEDNFSRPLSPASRFCAQCNLPVPYFAFSDMPPTLTCKHESNTCMECLARWVGEEIQAKGGSRVACPECDEALEFGDVKRVATSTDLRRYITSSCFFE
jgi:hypothetical protein